MKRSSAITLVLVGTTTALLGYTATHRDDDTDADYWDSTTQPSTRPSGYHSGSGYRGTAYHGYHHYWYGGSGSRSSSGTYSGSHSGTSRGGFGGSGHAAGS